MYRDSFFEFIQVFSESWIMIAMLYALIDYSFSTVMCWITGGFQSIKLSDDNTIKTESFIFDKLVIVYIAIQQFYSGGKLRWEEFRSDPLSWLWPITVLAFPTTIYGITQTSVGSSTTALLEAGIKINFYRLPVFIWLNDVLQYLVWGAALIVVSNTFVHYRRKYAFHWVSKSLIFHLLRLILFDFILAYMTINIILSWMDFALALYRVLLDDSVKYNVLYPDLMYGLRSAYEIVIGISLSLILVSLLPAIMFQREKTKGYRWVYYSITYGGILIVLVLAGLLIYQFNWRLEFIQQSSLTELQERIDLSVDRITMGASLAEISVALEYYRLVTTLPNSFPFPYWLQYILGARVVIFMFEIYRSLALEVTQGSISEIVGIVAKKLLN